MARKASSVDVARMAGVSQATVSYVLNARPDQIIREETRRRVLEAARSLNYQPNLAARTMVTGKSNMVALWVPNSARSVFNHVIEQVMRLTHESGFHVVVVQVKAETRASLTTAGLLSGRSVDAILALDARDLVNDILENPGHAPPIISIGPAYSAQTDHVGVDLYGGSLLATRHLWGSGCRRIAFAGVNSGLVEGDPRYDAYLAAAGETGMVPSFVPLESSDYEGGYQGVLRAFRTLGPYERPDGLFCWNDETAIGANRAISELGLRVPQDVAVIGSDGIRETRYAVPDMSTVAQPFAEMCETAWTFLEKRLQDPSAPVQSAILPMALEERASTRRA